MEEVVKSWEDADGHGSYVDRRRQVLVSSGARLHVCGDLARVGTAGSTATDPSDAPRGEVLESTSGVDREEAPGGASKGEL